MKNLILIALLTFLSTQAFSNPVPLYSNYDDARAQCIQKNWEDDNAGNNCGSCKYGTGGTYNYVRYTCIN